MWGSAVNAITIRCARRTYLQIEMVQLIQLWAGAVFWLPAAGSKLEPAITDDRSHALGNAAVLSLGTHTACMHVWLPWPCNRTICFSNKQTTITVSSSRLEFSKAQIAKTNTFRIQNPGPNQMDCPRKFKSPRSNEIQVVTNSMTYIQPCTRSCGMHRKTWIFA